MPCHTSFILMPSNLIITIISLFQIKEPLYQNYIPENFINLNDLSKETLRVIKSVVRSLWANYSGAGGIYGARDFFISNNVLLNKGDTILYDFFIWRHYSFIHIFICIFFLKMLLDLFIVNFGSFFKNKITDYIVKNTILEVIFLKLEESEREYGSSQEIVVLLLASFFSLTVSILASFFIVSKLFSKFALSMLFMIYIFINLLVLLLPLNFVIDCGVCLFVIIRGSSQFKSFNAQALNDYLLFGGMFLRLFVQNIRLLLGLLTFFECLIFVSTNYLFYANVSDSNIIQLSFFNKLGNFDFLFIWGTIVSTLFSCVYFLFMSLHSIFVIFTQFIVFLFISVVLFIFLYYTVRNIKYEFFF